MGPTLESQFGEQMGKCSLSQQYITTYQQVLSTPSPLDWIEYLKHNNQLSLLHLNLVDISWLVTLYSSV